MKNLSFYKTCIIYSYYILNSLFHLFKNYLSYWIKFATFNYFLIKDFTQNNLLPLFMNSIYFNTNLSQVSYRTFHNMESV